MSAAGAPSRPDSKAQPPPQQRSLGAAAKTIATDTTALVKAEVDLAKAEIASGMRAKALGAGLLGAAGALVAVAGLALLLAAGFGLSEGLGLPGWASALIVAGALLVVAAVLGLLGRSKLSTAVSTATAKESLNTDVAFVRQRFKART